MDSGRIAMTAVCIWKPTVSSVSPAKRPPCRNRGTSASGTRGWLSPSVVAMLVTDGEALSTMTPVSDAGCSVEIIRGAIREEKPDSIARWERIGLGEHM